MQRAEDLWKNELAELAAAFRERVALNVDPANAWYIERPLLYSAFIVRKLIEDIGVTDGTRSRFLDVVEHASTSDASDIFYGQLFGELDVRDHFDLDNGNIVRMSYADLASEVIHCDGLIWLPRDERVYGFMVFSYRNTHKRALVVTVDAYSEMIETVSRDYVAERWTAKDLKTGKITRHAK